MRTAQRQTVVIGSRVTPEFAERLRNAARQQDRSLGSLIRVALARELEHGHTRLVGAKHVAAQPEKECT